MTREEFNKLAKDYFTTIRNTKCDTKKAFQFWCSYIKERNMKPGLKQTAFTHDSGIAEDYPIFKYRNPHSALTAGKYIYNQLAKLCKDEPFLDYVGDWRGPLFQEEKPGLFEQPEAKPEPRISVVLYNLYENITDIGGHIAHIARTLDAISEKLEALRQ